MNRASATLQQNVLTRMLVIAVFAFAAASTSAQSCGIVPGMHFAVCETSTPSEADTYRVIIPYAGVQEGVTVVNNSGSGIVQGNDPAVVENGTIQINNISELHDYSVTFSSPCASYTISGTAPVCDGPPPLTVVINEVDYDNPGLDNDEWFELYNYGPDPVNVLDLRVQLVNGINGGGSVYGTFIIESPLAIPPGGYFVIGNNASNPAVDYVPYGETSNNLIQNGAPDAIALIDRWTSEIVDVISYEGNTAAPFFEGTGFAGGDDETPGKVIARVPNGIDTNDNNTDWKEWCATPGASNDSAPDDDGDGIPNCIDPCPLALNGIANFDVVTCNCEPGYDVNITSIGGNDVITACTSDFDCPLLGANIGTPCDDGDANTGNDTVDGECNCAGQPIDCEGVAGGSALPGTPCDDDNANTINDVIGNDCVCAGTDPCADDVTAPDAICQNITVQLDGNGQASITPQMVDGGSTDACGIVNMSLSQSAFDCSDFVAGGLRFDGIDDHVLIPDIAALNNASQFTIEARVTFHAIGQFMPIFVKRSEPNEYIQLQTDDNGRLAANIGAVGDGFERGSTVLSAGQEYLLTVVFNGDLVQSQRVKLYVDGVEETITDQAQNPAVTADAPSTPIYLGYEPPSLRSNMTLTEVRVWDHARTPAEVAAFAGAKLDGVEPGAVALYRFNQGISNGANAAETTLLDATGAHNGTLIDFALTGTASNWVGTGTNAVTLSVLDASNNVGTCTAAVTLIAPDADGDGIVDCSDPCPSAITALASFDENTCACEPGYYTTLTNIGGNDVITSCTLCPPGEPCPVTLVPQSGNNYVPCGTNTLLRDHGNEGDYEQAHGYTVLEANGTATIHISGSYATQQSWDLIRIFDGVGIEGTLLQTYSGTGMASFTGAPGQTLTVLFLSNGVEHYEGFEFQVAYTGTCNCSSPLATISTSKDCATGEFMIAIDISSLGEPAEVDIVPSVGDPVTGITATGLYTLSYPFGTAVSVMIAHAGGPECDLELGSFYDGGLGCTLTNPSICDLQFPVPDNGCDSNNYLEVPILVNVNGDELGTNVRFNSVDLIMNHWVLSHFRVYLVSPQGQELPLLLERGPFSWPSFGNPANCPTDVLTLKDDGAPLSQMFMGGTNIGVYRPEALLADFTGDPNGIWTLRICDAIVYYSGALQYVALNFDPCVEAIATTTVVPDCDNGQFFIDLDITSMGSAGSIGVVIGGNTVATATATGVLQLGPFASGSSVEITLENDDDSVCNTILPAVTHICLLNDECSSAIALPVHPDLNCTTVTLGTFVGATPSPPPYVFGQPYNDIWYSFVATSTSHIVHVQFSQVASWHQPIIALYRALPDPCSEAGMTLVHQAWAQPVLHSAGLTIGETYYVRVCNLWADTPVTTICVTTPPPGPVNDLCADAIPISCNQTVTGTSVWSSNMGVLENCSSPFSTNHGGVWYAVQGWGGEMTASLCGTSYSGDFGIFTGTCGDLVCVDWIDADWCDDWMNFWLTWDSSPGATYYIYVTGEVPNDETFTLTVHCDDYNPVLDCEGVLGGSALPGTPCDDGDANTINDVFDNDCGCAGVVAHVLVSARVYLEGSYDPVSGLMRDDLRALGLVPTMEPYTGLGHGFVDGGGETTSPPVLAMTGNDAIVDWVIMELRDKTDPTLVLHSRAALLQRDGDVVDVDGVSAVGCSLPADAYHVTVLHRNHLGCMTASPVPLAGAPAVVDLTAASTPTYGTAARKSMSGTMAVEALWAGDVNFDGLLRYTGQDNDRDPILQSIGGVVPTASAVGYLTTDVNMDGNVKYTGDGNDRDPILQNIGGVVPTNVRMEQVP